MGGIDAPHLYLRSDAASGVVPLGLSATYTAQTAGRRTSTRHDAKKTRMKETRLGKCGRGDSHAEGGGACTRRTKRTTTPVRRRAPAALGCHDPATPNAHGATPPSHRTSLALWLPVRERRALGALRSRDEVGSGGCHAASKCAERRTQHATMERPKPERSELRSGGGP